VAAEQHARSQASLRFRRSYGHRGNEQHEATCLWQPLVFDIKKRTRQNYWKENFVLSKAGNRAQVRTWLEIPQDNGPCGGPCHNDALMSRHMDRCNGVLRRAVSPLRYGYYERRHCTVRRLCALSGVFSAIADVNHVETSATVSQANQSFCNDAIPLESGLRGSQKYSQACKVNINCRNNGKLKFKALKIRANCEYRCNNRKSD
jgi:hypothetical protein